MSIKPYFFHTFYFHKHSFYLYFSITVVQSYFIYWTGIESAVVRDRSPGAWRGSKTKIVDEASTIFAAKETVTAQTGRQKITK